MPARKSAIGRVFYKAPATSRHWLVPASETGDQGIQGEFGASALIRTIDEPACENCEDSGALVEAGVDSDANGTLAAGEVTTSTDVCNGAAGAQGLVGEQGAAGDQGLVGDQGLARLPGGAGTAGRNSLSAVTSVAAGEADCATGGVRVDSGLDNNSDGMLDADEVTVSTALCNATVGTDGAGGGCSSAPGQEAPPLWLWSLVVLALFRRRIAGALRSGGRA